MSSRQITEIGFALGLLGALIMAGAALLIVLANRSYAGPTEAQHRREKLSNLLGALLIAAGFAAELIAVLNR
jgi:multisubunit Na+/H+ antiporter MnhB subunit